jgi:hypothetical protein
VKVQVWPADEGGCGHYRLIWPARALIDQGADVEVRLPGEGSGLDGVFTKEDGVERLQAIVSPVQADVVVVQRPLAAWRADIVPLLQAQGVRVVVEIDDDFSTIHPRNQSFRSCHPRRNPHTNWAHLARACREADLVTVTTPALARRYGAHGRVAVLPNLVPERYLTIEREPHDGMVVGWTGGMNTHPTDLQVTRGAVARTVEEQGATMAVVGTGVGVQAALALSAPPVASGWVDIADYPRTMAQFDVGIVPLDDIEFNKAKSALKLCEFAALGVPVVATPTPDNVRMFGEGVGVMAAKPKHWAGQLRHLLTDADHRAEVAERGRTVMRRHTIEGNADRWWNAWASPVSEKAVA